ncbi:MAG: hypothetical protein LBN09_03670 [Clostridioides sp.]|nr:hypothetical protein [Clostridioides sp.]
MKIWEFKKDRKNIIITLALVIPILFVAQFYLFKFGIVKPMIKGVELNIVKGDYIKDLDKYIIKLDDKVQLSTGKYIKIPSYAKDPDIRFNVLDNNGTIKIEGDELISLKEGYSSVGVMKNSRVLKKATIRVVDPKVNSLEINVTDDLKYVGDKSKIESIVDLDYYKFKTGYKPEIKSGDEDVIQIKGNQILAVGVGNTTITAEIQGKSVEKEFNIKAKVSEIKIPSNINIEIDQVYNLNPSITTEPSGLKHPEIIYSLVDYRLPDERIIKLNKNGKVTGVSEGKEDVRINCGNKSKIVTIGVVKESTANKRIKNLLYYKDIANNIMTVNLSWNRITNIKIYDIYMKNNLSASEKFEKIVTKTVDASDDKDSKVKYKFELPLIEGKADIDVYVVGRDDIAQTKPSQVINISVGEAESSVNIEDMAVEELSASLGADGRIMCSWGALSLRGCTYSVYVRDNAEGEGSFTLYKNGLYDNSYSFKAPSENVDLSVYVVATQNGNDSKASQVVNVKVE